MWPRDGHQRRVGGARFCHFGDGLMAEIVEAQAADRRGGSLPGYAYALKAFPRTECFSCSLSADAPGCFADEFSPRRAPTLLRAGRIDNPHLAGGGKNNGHRT